MPIAEAKVIEVPEICGGVYDRTVRRTAAEAATAEAATGTMMRTKSFAAASSQATSMQARTQASNIQLLHPPPPNTPASQPTCSVVLPASAKCVTR